MGRSEENAPPNIKVGPLFLFFSFSFELEIPVCAVTVPAWEWECECVFVCRLVKGYTLSDWIAASQQCCVILWAAAVWILFCFSLESASNWIMLKSERIAFLCMCVRLFSQVWYELSFRGTEKLTIRDCVASGPFSFSLLRVDNCRLQFITGVDQECNYGWFFFAKKKC